MDSSTVSLPDEDRDLDGGDMMGPDSDDNYDDEDDVSDPCRMLLSCETPSTLL